jgi:hypothetical protein
MFQIQISGQNADVFTPYNAEFVRRIKNAGGRWNGSSKCWTVPASAVDAVREIMRDVYGRDDVDAGDAVKVRLTFERRASGSYCEPLTIYGHTIAKAYGRDSGAKPGTGVFFVKGKPSSGGSAKNWLSYADEGSVVEIASVQRSLIEAEQLPDGVTMEIVNAETSTIDRDALTAEREKLMARIAEIDNALAE